MFGDYKKVLTASGAQLHAKCLAGESTSIEFTKFELGNGSYTGSETTGELAALTALKSKKEEFPVTKTRVVNHDTCELTLNASNLEITEGFSVTEVGVFAKGSDGNEILYSITVADPEHPDWMPAYNNVAPASLRYIDYISVGNADSIEITVTPGGLVSAEDFEKLEAETSGLGKPKEYLNSSPYTEGDTCIYNGEVYRCREKIESGEEWDETHWEKVNLYDEVGALQEETQAQFNMLDRKYRGVNLAEKFADEITAYIEGEEGKAAYGKVSGKADGHEDELKGWLWMKHRIDKTDFAGIHVGDWLPMTIHCKNEDCEGCAFHAECAGALKNTPETHKIQVAGIDTYYETVLQEWHHKYSSVTDKETGAIPHHIDFISKDVLTPCVKWNTDAVNCGEYCGKWICDNECPNYANRAECSLHKAKADIESLTANCGTCGKNTSCEFYKQRETGEDFCTDAGNDCPYNTSHIRKFLDFLYEHSAKDAYDGIITAKSMLGERRAYQYSNTQLTDSTGWHWYNFGKFWLPTEYEVHGSVVWGTTAWSSGQAVQYPLFAGRWDDKIKHIGPDGTVRSFWWGACAGGYSSTYACYVYADGHAYVSSAADAYIRVPVCFRIAAGDNQ